MEKKYRQNKKSVTNLTDKKLRQLIESKGNETIFAAESIHAKDSFHYLRAGLDQITLKIAHKRNKTIGFSFEDLKKIKNPIKQAKILARMQQNMCLCKKYLVKTKVTAKVEKESFQKILQKNR